MIDFDFNNLCTGCRVCADICSKNCITFYEDNDGFVMPKVVDLNLCIECHRCENVCPAIHPSSSSPSLHTCYAAYHEEAAIRHTGSSGSIFYALACGVISEGGVVYGAAMCSDLQLRHTRATDLEGIKRQMKSKYIQSDTSGVYTQVLEDVRKGVKVLFVGTPCQCKALHNLVSARLRNNLIIADFVCHGVPSQKLFNESVKAFESRTLSKVINFSFREKSDNQLRNYAIEYLGRKGVPRRVVSDPDEWPYCFGYFNHIIQRNSCYKCQMRTTERSSDITLADFWGVDKVLPGTKDIEKGYSMIVTNTSKGEEVIHQLHDCCIVKVEKGLDFCVKRNSAYTRPDYKSIVRSLFFWTYRHFGYSTAEKHFLQYHPSLIGRVTKSILIRIDNYSKYYTQWKRKL